MSRPTVFVTMSAEQTLSLGERLGRALRGGEVLALSGPLGAGKTCLVKGLSRGMGVPDDEPVTSPTFVLIREYVGRGLTLYHCDAYRLNSPQELVDLGLGDLWQQPDAVVAIEWADRFPGLLPRGSIGIEFEWGDSPDSRRIVVSGIELEDTAPTHKAAD